MIQFTIENKLVYFHPHYHYVSRLSCVLIYHAFIWAIDAFH